MRNKVFGKQLNKDTKERKALFRNLAKGIFLYGRIKTTKARAKAVKGWIEKLITEAKKDTLAARRRVLAKLGGDKKITKKVFDKTPSFKDRNGGYLRIIPLKQRLGDNAPIVLLEMVGFEDGMGERENIKDKKGKQIVEKKDKDVKKRN